MSTMAFHVPAPPPAKFTAPLGRSGPLNPEDAQREANAIRSCWVGAGSTAFTGLVELSCLFLIPRPEKHVKADGVSLSSVGRAAPAPTGPDAVELAEAVARALTGYAWADAFQIASLTAARSWAGLRPGSVPAGAWIGAAPAGARVRADVVSSFLGGVEIVAPALRMAA